MKKILSVIIVLLGIIACNETPNSSDIYIRHSSNLKPDSYCPLSIGNYYNYSIRLIDYKLRDTLYEEVRDTLISIGIKHWRSNTSGVLSYFSETYKLKKKYIFNLPLFYTENLGKEKFCYYLIDSLYTEVNISGNYHINEMNIFNLTYKDIIRVDVKKTYEEREYYFAKGIGLVKFVVYGYNNNNDLIYTYDCHIFEYNLK